jgi:hypothetical protein
MQLPRGTFREIKKNKKTSEILEDLERSRFCGICNISYRDILITLVMKAGRPILATAGTKNGDAALDELTAISAHNVDASLSTLDDAQVQLSLEFNKAERITRTGRTPRPPFNAAHPPGHSLQSGHDKKPVLSRNRILHGKAPDQESRQSAVPVNADVHPAQPAVQPPQPGELTAGVAKKPAPDEHTAMAHGDAPAGADEDIDTIDTIDMAHMTEKIRNDCKTVVKQLHLEHLMERD